MRIQHNIMAMNAYRNYTNNVSAMKNNLEKLSSGYKINRAGDDAAGLAISEKMRAQITGLEVAQKNAKDGISLVQTAEGALTEVHDMLNRMVELATQSANGTYDNDVDREQLQKELDQLTSEIDRIADSSNFNGIKLLNGDMDGSGDSLKAAQAAAKAAASAVSEMKAALDKANSMEVKGEDTALTDAQIEALFPEKSTALTDVGTKTIFETDFKETGPVGFSVNLDGVNYVMEGDDDKKVTLTINNVAYEITEAQIKANATDGDDLEAGSTVTGEQLAEAFAKAVPTWEDTTPDTANNYKVTSSGTVLTFAAQDNQATDPNRHYNVKISTDAATTPVAAAAAKYTTGALTAQAGATITKDEVIGLTVAYKYLDDDGNEQTGTKEVTYKVAETGGATDDAEKIATGLIAAINADDDLKALFTASGSNTGIVLTAKEAGAGKGAVTDITVTKAGDNSKMELAAKPTNDGDQVEGADAYTPGLGNSYVNGGTENIIMAGEEGKDLLASTTLDLSSYLKDGALIQLGNEKYRISIGPNSAYQDDVEGDTGEKLVRLDDAAATKDQIASKLAEVAANNDVFTVSHQGTDGKIGLKQLQDAKEDTNMSDLKNFSSYIKISTVTTAGDQAIKDAAIAEAQENYDAAVEKQTAADAKVAEIKKDPGKPLTLQIGDTADTFNQLKVNIKDMHANMLGIGGDQISIADQDSAAKAVKAIKDAINTVSDVRGTLGATQNRLDHTINNLSVMTENIQDAESTIRDVDVAEEMMAYTKNNILIQSAQAMLAQANQVPQGVLQLLG